MSENLKIDIDKIIKDAEDKICTILPQKIDERSKEIIDKILNNLTKKIKESYDDILASHISNIDAEFEKTIKPKIEIMYTEITGKIFNDLLNKKTIGGKKSRTQFYKGSNKGRNMFRIHNKTKKKAIM